MKNILEKLKEPFLEEELEFKIGATNSEKTMGLALAYVQARAIQKRLDDVVGVENWKISYKEITNGFLAKLEIRINNEWIGKEDGANNTEYEAIKGGISSALKRVASVWGIGRYLYELESKWYPIEKKGKSYSFVTTPKLSSNNTVQNEKNTKEIKAKNIVIDFGKYKGHKLGEIMKENEKYLIYLKENSKDIKLVNACCYLLKLKEVA